MTTLTPRLAALHAQCREDYAKGQGERAAHAHTVGAYTPIVTAASVPAPPEPADLDTAILIAQRMLATYGDASVRDLKRFAQAHGGITEALRLLLRALGAEPTGDHR